MAEKTLTLRDSFVSFAASIGRAIKHACDRTESKSRGIEKFNEMHVPEKREQRAQVDRCVRACAYFYSTRSVSLNLSIVAATLSRMHQIIHCTSSPLNLLATEC